MESTVLWAVTPCSSEDAPKFGRNIDTIFHVWRVSQATNQPDAGDKRWIQHRLVEFDKNILTTIFGLVTGGRRKLHIRSFIMCEILSEIQRVQFICRPAGHNFVRPSLPLLAAELSSNHSMLASLPQQCWSLAWLVVLEICRTTVRTVMKLIN
jgi:hypothetical protein